MTWSKFGDEFADDEQWQNLDPFDRDLFTQLVIFANGKRWEREGVLSQRDINQVAIAFNYEEDRVEMCLRHLGEAEFVTWDADGFLVILDFVDRYGRPADAIRAEKASWRERQRRLREKRKLKVV